MPSIQQTIAPVFLRRLLRSKRGRSFVMTQAAQAEASDEGRIFDELLARVEDSQIRKLVRVHQADEERHAELFAAAAERTGVKTPTLPDHLAIVEQLDVALGGFFEQFQRGEQGVMDLYLLLQVIEERATTQFQIMEPELRRYDVEAADMVKGIAADEERHLKYCRAIAKKFAPSEETLDRRLRELREVEAEVFGRHSQANMAYCLDNELVDIPAHEMPFWRALQRLGARRQMPVSSAFWDAPSPIQLHWNKLLQGVKERVAQA